jgi:hypothetical protein
MATEKEIRQRASYTHWKGWIEFLDQLGIDEEAIPTILDRVWQDMDGRSAFHSERNSKASAESKFLAIQDWQTE